MVPQTLPERGKCVLSTTAIAIAFAFALVASGCDGDSENTGSDDTATPDTSVAADTAQPDTAMPEPDQGGGDADASELVDMGTGCSYPTHDGFVEMGKIMPELSWPVAYTNDGSQAPFSLADFFCDEETYGDYNVMLFFLSADWCPACHETLQDFAMSGYLDSVAAAGAFVVIVEAENLLFAPATAEEGFTSVTADMPAFPGVVVGDAETVPGPAPSTLTRSRLIGAFPTGFIVRRSDMRVISPLSDGETYLDLPSIAADPDAYYMGPPPDPVPNCGPAEEEASESVNDVVGGATLIEEATLTSGGICNDEPDFWRVDISNNWLLQLSFDATLGDLDFWLWDEVNDTYLLDGNGQRIGSAALGSGGGLSVVWSCGGARLWLQWRDGPVHADALWSGWSPVQLKPTLLALSVIAALLAAAGCDSGGDGNPDSGDDTGASEVSDVLGTMDTGMMPFECTVEYPMHDGTITLGKIMPDLAWSSAYLGDESETSFSLRDFHCNPAWDRYNVVIFLVLAFPCGLCEETLIELGETQYIDRIDQAGGLVVIFEAVDLVHEPVTSFRANEVVNLFIPEHPGIVVGDADSVPGPPPSPILFSPLVGGLPAGFVVRRDTMRVISPINDGEFLIDLEAVARDPAAFDMGPPLNTGPNCDAAEEEAGDVANDTIAGASVASSTQENLGGICNDNPDFWRINLSGNWLLQLSFDATLGDLDFWLWDEVNDTYLLDGGGQRIGSATLGSDEIFQHCGESLIRVFGYNGSTAPYRLLLSDLGAGSCP